MRMALHDAELDVAVPGRQLVLVGDCCKDKAREVVEAGRRAGTLEASPPFDHKLVGAGAKQDLHGAFPTPTSYRSKAHLVHRQANVFDFVVDEPETTSQTSCGHPRKAQELWTSRNHEAYYVDVSHYPSKDTTRPARRARADQVAVYEPLLERCVP